MEKPLSRSGTTETPTTQESKVSAFLWDLNVNKSIESKSILEAVTSALAPKPNLRLCRCKTVCLWDPLHTIGDYVNNAPPVASALARDTCIIYSLLHHTDEDTHTSLLRLPIKQHYKWLQVLDTAQVWIMWNHRYDGPVCEIMSSDGELRKWELWPSTRGEAGTSPTWMVEYYESETTGVGAVVAIRPAAPTMGYWAQKHAHTRWSLTMLTLTSLNTMTFTSQSHIPIYIYTYHSTLAVYCICMHTGVWTQVTLGISTFQEYRALTSNWFCMATCPGSD